MATLPVCELPHRDLMALTSYGRHAPFNCMDHSFSESKGERHKAAMYPETIERNSWFMAGEGISGKSKENPNLRRARFHDAHFFCWNIYGTYSSRFNLLVLSFIVSFRYLFLFLSNSFAFFFSTRPPFVLKCDRKWLYKCHKWMELMGEARGKQ